jgi:uncharacterized delta-60 repeat protein
MKKIAASLVLVLLTAALPAAAHAGGSLDPSFGAAGRVLVPAPGPFYPGGPEANARLSTAAGAGGELVAVAGDRRVMRFLENGKPDPSFGGDGSVELTVESGRSFSVAGVVVDSQGRILVGGTSTPPPGTLNPLPDGSGNGPTPTRATVIRYLPDGSLDPSFGNGGIATTSFELPPPQGASGFYSDPRFESAAVTATALAVTPADQPVVAGSFATLAIESSCSAQNGYVGRLEADGDVDRAFGKNGAAVDELVRQPQLLARSPLGDLFISGRTAPSLGACPSHGPQSIDGRFSDLLPGGLPNTAFGGGVPHNSSLVYGLAADSRGRLVSLEQSFSSSYPEDEGKLQVRRLLPNGTPDLAFGKDGSVSPKASLGAYRRVGIQVMALDGRNRILLEGGGKTARGAFGFQLMRLGTKGKLDRGFGRRGRIKTGFGTAAETKASAISLGDDGKVVLGGSITGSPRLPDGNGFAFARYSLGG